MNRYSVSLEAFGWAVLVLLGHFSLIIAAESDKTSPDSTEVKHREWPTLALTSTRHLNVESGPSPRQLLRQSYLKPSAEKTGRASERIMKDLTEVFKSESYKRGLIKVALVDDDLYDWEVKLSIADKDSQLHRDLVKLWGKEDYVVLRVAFNDNYPNDPPFVRIAYPFLRGKHVERGGTLCMALLSKNGWNNKCTLESLFLSITILLIRGQTRVDSVKSEPEHLEKTYNEDAARNGFDWLVKSMERAGWYNI